MFKFTKNKEKESNIEQNPKNPQQEAPTEQSQEQNIQEPDSSNIITIRELKSLKKANYEKIREKFNTEYTLKNIRTGQIVGIRAASSFHACNIIGWKKSKVRLIDQKEIEKEVEKETEEKSDEQKT